MNYTEALTEIRDGKKYSSYINDSYMRSSSVNGSFRNHLVFRNGGDVITDYSLVIETRNNEYPMGIDKLYLISGGEMVEETDDFTIKKRDNRYLLSFKTSMMIPIVRLGFHEVGMDCLLRNDSNIVKLNCLEYKNVMLCSVLRRNIARSEWYVNGTTTKNRIIAIDGMMTRATYIGDRPIKCLPTYIYKNVAEPFLPNSML